ncbi:hypothetical protein [uncultured Pseudacidovorax sp.]|uniref:hypothetical protein n=1 Tax=uncultured Pseudacidovorax sp. TaxID=679313 RepID=UPI0025FCBAF7|nr:hypothetical protein [uncultured Pseudacidovorax sp.]
MLALHPTTIARVKRALTDWALAALVATFILAATIGTDDAREAAPSPAVADAIEGARIAARDRTMPEQWPPR